MIKKKKRRKASCRSPQIDWNQFVVDWNSLHSSGANVGAACQFFGETRACLAVRRGQLAKLGIYLPCLENMRGFKNRAWKRGEKRVVKATPRRPAPQMLADMASAGMVFRLMPVAAS